MGDAVGCVSTHVIEFTTETGLTTSTEVDWLDTLVLSGEGGAI